MVKRILSFIISIITLLIFVVPVFAASNIVINNVVMDEAGRMMVIDTANNQTLPKPDISRMVNPNRLIINIPDAVLGMKPKIVKINNNNLSVMRVLELKHKGVNTVRIIVETSGDKIIDKVKISENSGSTYLQLDSLPSSSSSELLDDNKLAKITKIDYRDNQLVIGSVGAMKTKPMYILKNPNRIVLDITNAVVTDKKLLSPILVGDTEVDIVRIGQFDDTTVRVVIETNNPNRLNTVYGNDQQSLIITSNPTFSISNLPQNASMGFLKKLKVIKDINLGTIVRIESNTNLIHRVKRIHGPEKVIVDLINVEPPKGDISSNLDTTEELSGVRVGQLMAGNQNSRIVLDLSSPNIEARANLSADGKIMEIVLKQGAGIGTYTAGSKDSTVVIDPGHGGYEPGCQAEGYKEKDINLDVSKRVKLLLEKAGVKVVMTRQGDSTVSLKERTDFTNNINPTAFVSIHVNASKSSAPEGISTHWYSNQSIPLAKSIQNSVMKRVSAVDRGLEKNMFYVIHHTGVPAVLVEIGFLTNPRERVDIVSHERKQNTAAGIAEGVLQFLGTKKSISQPGSRR